MRQDIKSTLKELNTNRSITDILDKIEKYLSHQGTFFHITSLNPEIINYMLNDFSYKRIITSSQIIINDGIGIVVAGRILGVDTGPRVTGVDLMTELLSYANKKSLSVMLIGGGPKIADKVVNCQKLTYPNIKFASLQGIKNIKNPKKQELKTIFSIVKNTKPHFVFVAFGSPSQEIFIDKYKKQFNGAVCMGVGGAFDFLSGNLPRPPYIIRQIGLEWLFRVLNSPKRLKKQQYWIIFILKAIKERFIK